MSGSKILLVAVRCCVDYDDPPPAPKDFSWPNNLVGLNNQSSSSSTMLAPDYD